MPAECGAGDDRRRAHVPALAPILRNEKPEPFLAPPVANQTSFSPCVTRHVPLAAKCLRRARPEEGCRLRNRHPAAAAVRRADQLKASFDRIAQGDTVLLIPKGHGIEEGRGIGVFKLKGPRLAAVDRFVDAGFVARAGARSVSRVFAECLDVAEVETCPHRARCRSSNSCRHQSRAEDTHRAADPNDLWTRHAETAEIGFGVDDLRLPLGQRKGAASAKKTAAKMTRFMKVFPVSSYFGCRCAWRHPSE